MTGLYGNHYFSQNYQNQQYPYQTTAPMYPQMQTTQQFNQGYIQPQVPTMQNHIPLQGKMVDSIDVVKAYDVPLTGEPVFFPKLDLSEIYTKQIQPNGTSKTNVYRLVSEETANEGAVDNVSMFANIMEQFKQEVVEEVSKQITGIKDMLPAPTKKQSGGGN